MCLTKVERLRPLELYIMFSLDYKELLPGKSLNYEPVPIKLPWQEIPVDQTEWDDL